MSARRLGANPSKVLLIFLGVVFTISAWLSSGTLTPYAASYDKPHIIEPCRYVANIDHQHFIAGFHMLAGEPRETWVSSFMLRRILYPLIAFPFVAVMGFEWGGLLVNIALHLLAYICFLRFVSQKFGTSRALAVAPMLATYPGAAYWIGLPYSYALIVPGCLVLTIALYHLNETSDARAVVGWSLFMGVVYVGYDLLPIFAPAAVLLLLWRRQLKFAVIVAALSVMPTVLMLLILKYVAQVPLVNDNTAIYWTVLTSYFGPFDTAGWARLLADLPIIVVEVFLASNFFVLPLLFLVALGINWLSNDRIQFDRVESVILLSMLGIFLFNNLAPPYPQWQMRGMWIPRIYQPTFVVYLLYVARMADQATGWSRRILLGGVITCSVANTAIVFSPVLAWSPGLHVYSRFYKHAPIDTMEISLRNYGKRPLGFCEPNGGRDQE